MFQFRSWLRQLARKLGWTYRRVRRKPRLPVWTQVQVEELEVRLVPAQITWVNAAGGSWGTAGNWNLNRVPTSGDDVVIPNIGTFTVTYSSSSGTTSINSVTASEALTLSGGTLNVVGNGLGTAVSSFAAVTIAPNGANGVSAALNLNSGAVV